MPSMIFTNVAEAANEVVRVAMPEEMLVTPTGAVEEPGQRLAVEVIEVARQLEREPGVSEDLKL